MPTRIRRAPALPQLFDGVGWWQPPARSAARPAAATDPPGRVRRRPPGRAPADALTAPVGPALRGGLLAELDRGVPVRTAPNRRVPGRPAPDRTPPARIAAQRAPAQRAPAERAPAQHTPAEHTPAQHTPAQLPPRIAPRPAVPGRSRPGGASLRRLVPRLPRTRRGALQLATAALGAAALAPVVAFVLGYAFFAVPTPDDAVNNQVALIAYADGSQITRLVPEQGNRVVVPIEKVPPHVRRAVLAAEDRSFYSNPGFDLTGIVRAAWNQLRGGVGGWLDHHPAVRQEHPRRRRGGRSGASTGRCVVAVKISPAAQQGRDLGDYLNAIYFGRGAYGIQSAAHAYYGKPVSALTPADGAPFGGADPSRRRAGTPPNDREGRAALELRPRRDGRAGLAPARRTRGGGVPADDPAQAVDWGRAHGRAWAHRDGRAAPSSRTSASPTRS